MAVTCPICERAELKSRTVVETIRYGDGELRVPGIHVSECPNCKEVLVTPSQAKTNARIFADAKRAHDGLLTSAAIVSWRETLGFTQSEAARLLGGGVHAFSKYERGEVLQSRAMDLLMRVTGCYPETHGILRAQAGLVTEAKVTKTITSSLSHVGWAASKNALVSGVFTTERTRVAANEDHGRWEMAEASHGCR